MKLYFDKTARFIRTSEGELPMSYQIKPDQIISDYYDAILAHCNFKLNFDTVTAYEITQDAFYQLLLHWDQIRSKNEPVLVSWLYKTSDILIKKHFRIKKSEEKIISIAEFDEENISDENFQIDKDILAREEDAQYLLYLQEIKGALTKREALIFEYVIEKKLSVAQTAQILNMKENTVMIYLYRARKKAKKFVSVKFPNIVKSTQGEK